MKKILFLLAFAVAAGARAQTPAPTPAPDAAKLALAREVIAAMQADKLIDRMTGQMKQMATQMAGASANLSPEKRARAEALQGKIMALSVDMTKSLLTKMDTIYADVFTDAELKAMKAFYTSPEGASAQLKQAEIAKRLMPAVQEMQRGLMPKIQQIIADAQAEEAKADAAAAAAAKPAEPAK